MPLIIGGNLSDLGRNVLLDQQQQQDARDATARLLLNQFIARSQDRNAQDDRQLRRDEMGQRYGFLDRDLGARERMSGNQLALSRELGMLPYTKMPLADTERLTLEREKLKADEAYRTRLLDAQTQNQFGLIDPALRSKLVMDAIQKKEMADAATNRANQLLAASIGAERNALVDRLDSGAGTGARLIPGSGMWRGDAMSAADDIISGRTRSGDTGEGDMTFTAGRSFWRQKENELIRGVLDSLGEGASYTTYDQSSKRFVPSDFASRPNQFTLMSKPSSAPVTGTNAPDAAAILKEAERAIASGADTNAVRARLRELGINIQ